MFTKCSGGIQILTKRDSSDYLQNEVILRSISSKYLNNMITYRFGERKWTPKNWREELEKEEHGP
jgi:hypothetical protein